MGREIQGEDMREGGEEGGVFSFFAKLEYESWTTSTVRIVHITTCICGFDFSLEEYLKLSRAKICTNLWQSCDSLLENNYSFFEK